MAARPLSLSFQCCLLAFELPGVGGLWCWVRKLSSCYAKHIIFAEDPALACMQGKIVVRQLDLADLQSVKKFAEGVGKELGRLDLLILNAGAAGRQRPASWRRAVACFSEL